jgi:hypothetical protein
MPSPLSDPLLSQLVENVPMRPIARRPLRVAVTACLAFVAAATAIRAEPIRNVLLTATPQTVPPEQLVPQRFSVRVERADGTPVAGATVVFEVNVCIEPGVPIGPGCPTGAEYGGFETGGPGRPLLATVTTDSNGIATAPDFRVGTPLPFRGNLSFAVYPYVPPQTAGGGVVIGLGDSLNPINGLLGGATTVIILGGSAAAEVPTVSTLAAGAMALLLAAVALARLR